MRIVAVMACRNEAALLPTCLRHLIREGIDFGIVDNDSTDDSLAIVQDAEFRPHLAGITRVPFSGQMDLDLLLAAKQELHDSIKSDWAMNICPDEILHSNRQHRTLGDEVADAERAGFNVINFDEFVMLPVERPYAIAPNGWPELRHYYFFEPQPRRQMRLWKKGNGFENRRHGGHQLDGMNVRVSPEALALRHYLFRSQQHAYEKFTTRKFSAAELARGWHQNRSGFAAENFIFPPAAKLECLTANDSFTFSRANPRTRHYWEPRPDSAACVSSPWKKYLHFFQ